MTGGGGWNKHKSGPARDAAFSERDSEVAPLSVMAEQEPREGCLVAGTPGLFAGQRHSPRGQAENTCNQRNISGRATLGKNQSLQREKFFPPLPILDSDRLWGEHILAAFMLSGAIWEEPVWGCILGFLLAKFSYTQYHFLAQLGTETKLLFFVRFVPKVCFPEG